MWPMSMRLKKNQSEPIVAYRPSEWCGILRSVLKDDEEEEEAGGKKNYSQYILNISSLHP